jgi:hypothetical protein
LGEGGVTRRKSVCTRRLRGGSEQDDDGRDALNEVAEHGVSSLDLMKALIRDVSVDISMPTYWQSERRDPRRGTDRATHSASPVCEARPTTPAIG